MHEMYELLFDSVENETDKAYLIEFDPDTIVWIPKSQSEEPSNGTIMVKQWLVEENELDGYII